MKAPRPFSNIRPRLFRCDDCGRPVRRNRLVRNYVWRLCCANQGHRRKGPIYICRRCNDPA
jgi:hypothetical protein